MFPMVIEIVFIPDMTKVTTELDRKIFAVGIAKILTECPQTLNGPYAQNCAKLLQALEPDFRSQTAAAKP